MVGIKRREVGKVAVFAREPLKRLSAHKRLQRDGYSRWSYYFKGDSLKTYMIPINDHILEIYCIGEKIFMYCYGKICVLEGDFKELVKNHIASLQ
jgi:hypothetical protein